LRADYHDCCEQGKIALERDDHDLAICCFSESIRLARDLEAGYRGRGLAYLKKGACAQAAADLSEAIRLRSDNAPAYFYRSFCHSGFGDAARERRDYETAVALDPGVEQACQQGGPERVAARVRTSQPVVEMGNSHDKTILVARCQSGF
jgi:tetratricopeptide (TPR) repeat protein